MFGATFTSTSVTASPLSQVAVYVVLAVMAGVVNVRLNAQLFELTVVLIPGPDTTQDVSIPVPLRVSVVVCPERTRSGEAVKVTAGSTGQLPAPPTVTSGQNPADGAPVARTCIAYVPGVESVRLTVAPDPKLPLSEEVHEYGELAPLAGVAVYVTCPPVGILAGDTVHETVGGIAAATVTLIHAPQLLP